MSAGHDRNGWSANGGRNGTDPADASNPEAAAGASRRKMSFQEEIGDANAERVLRGETPAGADPTLAELAAFAAELRSLYVEPPAPDARERHIEAIVAAAAAQEDAAPALDGRRGAGPIRSVKTQRRRLAMRAAAVGVATLLGTAGLAVAGVKPPAPLDSALERVGISSGGGNDDRRQAGEQEGGGAPSGGEGAGSSGSARPSGDDAGPGIAGASPESKPRSSARQGNARSPNSKRDRRTANEAQGQASDPSSSGRAEEPGPGAAPPPPPAANPGSPGSSQGSGSQGGKGQAAKGQGKETAKGQGPKGDGPEGPGGKGWGKAKGQSQAKGQAKGGPKGPSAGDPASR